ncbi:hypothetical protein EJ06DRAFT_243372 [Trichodelitschia bisporula]|uniref:Uncharacterized protein n=1 Tax=Trichodelitschia bisporula TaxID=703511 RepID=A0A6G1HJ60_9PEZI|nr:hypothetical protein EJ06DRAFT_243372 [Trichodelitschia bisporula]
MPKSHSPYPRPLHQVPQIPLPYTRPRPQTTSSPVQIHATILSSQHSTKHINRRASTSTTHRHNSYTDSPRSTSQLGTQTPDSSLPLSSTTLTPTPVAHLLFHVHRLRRTSALSSSGRNWNDNFPSASTLGSYSRSARGRSSRAESTTGWSFDSLSLARALAATVVTNEVLIHCATLTARTRRAIVRDSNPGTAWRRKGASRRTMSGRDVLVGGMSRALDGSKAQKRAAATV